MTSSISWIDREGLEETLARIGFHGRAPAGRLRHVPVTLDSARPLPETATQPVAEEPALSDRASSPEEPATTTAPQIIPEFLPPNGPLRRRLEAFITWLVQTSGAGVAFIVDRDGLPLVDRQADPDLLTVASSVMRLVASINSKLLVPVGRAVTIELEERQLMLIAVETPIGKYIIGQVGDRPLGRELCNAATDALRRAFQPGTEPEAASLAARLRL